MKLLKRLTHEEQDKLIELLFDYEKHHDYSYWGALMQLYGDIPSYSTSPTDLKQLISKNDIDGIRLLIRDIAQKKVKEEVDKKTKLQEKGH